jgi:hypothetical protein
MLNPCRDPDVNKVGVKVPAREQTPRRYHRAYFFEAPPENLRTQG